VNGIEYRGWSCEWYAQIDGEIHQETWMLLGNNAYDDETEPDATITEAVRQGEIWECTMNDWHLPFQSEKGPCQHFTQAHAAYGVEGWKQNREDWCTDGANELKIRKIRPDRRKK
jgi:hypothetical protein